MVAKTVPAERLVSIVDAPEEVAKEAFTFCFFPEGPLSLPIIGRFGERKKLNQFNGEISLSKSRNLTHGF